QHPQASPLTVVTAFAVDAGELGEGLLGDVGRVGLGEPEPAGEVEEDRAVAAVEFGPGRVLPVVQVGEKLRRGAGRVDHPLPRSSRATPAGTSGSPCPAPAAGRNDTF